MEQATKKENKDYQVELTFLELQKLSIMSAKLPDDVFKAVKDEVDILQKNNYNARKYNGELAGAIEKEYQLTTCEAPLNVFLGQVVPHYLMELGAPPVYLNNNKFFINKKLPLNLPDLWVNFQKKYEYNPLHTHGGEFSFIIYVNVPFDLEEEKNLPINKNQYGPFKSYTSINFRYPVYNSSHVNNGGIGRYQLDIDKSKEGHIFVFPAWLNHEVFPFYTSDDYRISVSGNIVSTQYYSAMRANLSNISQPQIHSN